jgi:Predicted periplasmic solute-binding protein
VKLKIGFSPCPNDTFIFDALVNKKIDTEGIDFEVNLEDIQTLNTQAAEQKSDVTKLSFPAFFENIQQYSLLDSGAAMGKGVGPLLIAKKLVNVPDFAHCTIAIPGINTTANFLLSFAFPSLVKKVPMLFSDIENAVCNEETDLGVIIHENRFTYQQKGLIKVYDLGEIWEERQKLPIPLAGIFARSDMERDLQKTVSRLIRKSVEYAFQQYPKLSPFVINHAQAMEESVMKQHIELYVNDYTIDIGADGKKAIELLHKEYDKLKVPTC